MLTMIESWFAKPFNADMDVWHWAAFVLLIVVLVFAWTRILGMIVEIA